jgi:ABC-type glycerol-3-phosphate transport system permease component
MTNPESIPVPRAKRERWSIVLALTIGSVLIIVPFYWMITMSFKTPAEAYSWPPTLAYLPRFRF